MAAFQAARVGATIGEQDPMGPTRSRIVEALRRIPGITDVDIVRLLRKELGVSESEANVMVWQFDASELARALAGPVVTWQTGAQH